jgi:hypothetical protein
VFAGCYRNACPEESDLVQTGKRGSGGRSPIEWCNPDKPLCVVIARDEIKLTLRRTIGFPPKPIPTPTEKVHTLITVIE